MFKEQVKHQYLKAEITPALHFCVQSWHELVLLSPAVKDRTENSTQRARNTCFMRVDVELSIQEMHAVSN